MKIFLLYYKEYEEEKRQKELYTYLKNFYKEKFSNTHWIEFIKWFVNFLENFHAKKNYKDIHEILKEANFDEYESDQIIKSLYIDWYNHEKTEKIIREKL